MEGKASFKRKSDHNDTGSHKAPKLGGSGGGGGKMSFAQRMMAKMGYVEGQGLGQDGSGIVNPIEVKLRPQGAGVGTVREKTEQYKQEQKRAAVARGEEYEDSSDEERRMRRERKRKAQTGGLGTGSGASRASTLGGGRRPKTKYRTVADLQAAAPGLDVPAKMLSTILDATGSQTRMLTSTAGLMTPTGIVGDTEADKIAKRERLELEAFIDAWHGLQEQKVYVEEHEGQLQVELEQQEEEVQKLQAITEAVAGLQIANNDLALDLPLLRASQWEELVSELEALQIEHRHDIEKYDLAEAAVAAVHPLFKALVGDWDPLEEPTYLAEDLARIRILLGNPPKDALATSNGNPQKDGYGRSRRQRTTSPYETMIYTLWLPKIRSTIIDWDAYDSKGLTALVEAWRHLLPPFVYSNLLDQLIIPKLFTALSSWNPRKQKHHHKHGSHKQTLPHTWIHPWLPYLPSYHLDPKAPSGLLAEVKRKLRLVFDSWDISLGALPGLSHWRELLQTELDHALVRHLLPRLAMHMAQNFEVDPANQNLTPLEDVLKWQDYFKLDVFGRLLQAEFFPKWLSTLHLWLTSEEASFDEISQWYAWWKTQIPDKIAILSDVQKEWNKGLDMINTALDLRDASAPPTDLPPPPAGPARPIAKETAKHLDTWAKHAPQKQPAVELRLQDIVDQWCVEQDLTLLPTREAHPMNGLPLWRITASATGKGGVVVFFRGDVVWAQRKGDRSAWDPIEIGDALLARAEGR